MTTEIEAGSTYDAVPYRDHTHPFTHPRNLEAIAALFGMQPPPIPTCRVLELGCAGGGNLIPQAAGLPQARFVGVDLSQRQIDVAVQRVRELGLTNIEFRQANILDIDDSWGQFDYIIAHGVLSWVPPSVRDKVIEVCGRNLSPSGVAFVSYNTYPGWHLVNVVRDLMCYHTAPFSDPAKKIQQAKAILEFLIEISSDKTPVGILLRDEFKVLSYLNNDSYLFHEHLETDNHPSHFHEIVTMAEKVGLQYLADSNLSAMLVDGLPEKARETFRKLSLVQQEQYADFVRARRFRRTLLCHQEIRLERELTPALMKQFSFALNGPLDAKAVDIRNDERAEFRIGQACLTSRNRLVKAAIIYLHERRPQFVSFSQLYATALARISATKVNGKSDIPLTPEALREALLTGCMAEFFPFCLHPPECTYQATERPLASPVARWQAEQSGPMTNLKHEMVHLDDLSRQILRRLDGRHTRRDLMKSIGDDIQTGKAPLPHGLSPSGTADPRILTQVVDQSLTTILQAGLLMS